MKIHHELNIDQMDTGAVSPECLEALLHKDRLAHWGKLLYGLIHNMNGRLQNMTLLVDMVEAARRKSPSPAGHGREEGTFSGQEEEKQKKRLGQLAQQVQVLTEMLQDFMVLDSMEQTEKDTDIGVLLKRLVRVYKADLFFKNKVKVTLELDEEIPRIKIPGRVLVPSFMHLFDNALAALGESREKTLHIQCRRESPFILVSFTDTGCGPAPEHASGNFYTPFQKSDHSGYAHPDRRHRHFGLGFFIICRLLDPYGVRVALEGDGEKTSTVLKIPSIW